MLNLRSSLRYLGCLFLGSLVFSGCTLAAPDATSVDTSVNSIHPLSLSKTNLSEVLQGEDLIAFLSNNQLQIVDPVYAQPVEVASLKIEQMPVSSRLFDFQVSPAKKWIVWYAPRQGILSLDLSSQNINRIEPASTWLNSNPYFEFSPTADLLYFITQEGKSFNKYHLLTQQKVSFTIPYPFGTEFRVSPDNQKILYISGFNQLKTPTQFMFTDMQGKNTKRFTTQTELADRYLVEWTPDSSGVLMVQGKQINFYSYYQPNQTRQLFSVPDRKIIDLKVVEDLIYVLEETGYWHVFSYSQNKIVGQTPAAIASELTKPKFYPWENKKFLIVETKQGLEHQYQRLWVSDFAGVKKLIIPEFNQVKPPAGKITL